MKTKLLLYLIFIISGISCNGQKKQINLCISNELYECATAYIDDNKWNMPSLERYDEKTRKMKGYSVYYTAFFFERDHTNYFTLWKAYWYPKDWLEEVKGDVSYLYYNIEGKDFFIAFSSNKKENLMFSLCKESIKLGKEKQKDSYEGPIYDGSLFPSTYEYGLQDDRIFIKKQDSTILDFSPGWAEYEALLQREKGVKREHE